MIKKEEIVGDLKLIEAVKAENVMAIKELVESNVDVNQQDEHGWTPLNWAAGKGNLEIVKMLIEHGADIFKVGRDQRTPYMIALAAGRTEVVKFLRQVEDHADGEKPSRPERKYCKAYHLKDFRQFLNWTESKINWKEKKNDGSGEGQKEVQALNDDDIVFLHQDYTVTQSMWHNENVIFNQITPEWKEFCTQTLNFRVRMTLISLCLPIVV
jgi:hypothetical protein